MAGADESPEQAIAIEVAREKFDASPSGDPARVPIGASRRIEARAQKPVIGLDILPRVGFSEEAPEGVIVRQRTQGAQLQLAERDMRAIEIHRDDPRGAGGEVRQDIAAARSDGDDTIVRLYIERGEIDARVLPDLRIDQTAKRHGE